MNYGGAKSSIQGPFHCVWEDVTLPSISVIIYTAQALAERDMDRYATQQKQ